MAGRLFEIAPPYLSPESLLLHPNLKIFSHEGLYFQMNKLALVSLGSVLSSESILEPNGDPDVIVTDLNAEELGILAKFLVSGYLPQQLRTETIRMFSSIGIDLFQFKLTKVKLESSEEFFEPELLEASGDIKRDRDGGESPSFPQQVLEIGFPAAADEDDKDLPILFEGSDPGNASLEEEGNEISPKPKRSRTVSKKRSKKTPRRTKKSKGEKKEEIATLPQNREPGPRDPELLFQCPFCNFGANDSSALDRHRIVHRTSGRCDLPFTCLVCKTEVKDEKHYLHDHTGHPYNCSQCTRQFKKHDFTKYVEHVKSHDPEYRRLTSLHCTACGLRALNLKMLLQHQKRHGPYHNDTCNQCPARFESWEQHQEHIFNEHGRRWVLICGKCPETFETERERQSHRKSNHERKDLKCCEVCGKHTRSLREHIAKMHTEKTCERCGLITDRLDKHFKEVHWDAPPLSNSHLDHNNTSTKSSTLKRKAPDPIEGGEGHDRIHCIKCEKPFINVKARQKHENDYCLKKVQCDQCPIICANIHVLKVHILTKHTEEKDRPFQCSKCERGFATSARLASHQDLHSGEKKHICRACGKTFNSSGARGYHEVNVHNIRTRAFKSRKQT